MTATLATFLPCKTEITPKVVAAIEPKLLEAEAVRSQNRSPEDIGAWDMVMHANSLFWRLNKPDGEAAIAMLRRAVTQYPDYGPAHSMLAFILLISGRLAWTSAELEAQVPEAQKLAARAMSLDSSDLWAHFGFVAYTKRSTDEAVLLRGRRDHHIHPPS
jgi:adenylate cyclase